MQQVIGLRESSSGAAISMSDGGDVITDQLAEAQGVREKDSIRFDMDGIPAPRVLPAITVNYPGHAHYMPPMA